MLASRWCSPYLFQSRESQFFHRQRDSLKKKKKRENFPELLIGFYLNPDKRLDQAAVSSAGKCTGKTKKKSETVSETHLLLAGQPACENQASFHWQC